MHQGPEAAASNISCCAGVRAIARCFFNFGGSLFVTGLVVINPHRIAREYALETTPAILRTVFGLIERAVLSLRVRPPPFNRRFHSRLRWSAVISEIGMAR